MAEQSFTINPGITEINYPTARALIDSGQCLLIDVREKRNMTMVLFLLL